MASQPIPVSEMNKGAEKPSVPENSSANTPSNPPHSYCSFKDMAELKSIFKMLQNKRINVVNDMRSLETNLVGVEQIIKAVVETEKKK